MTDPQGPVINWLESLVAALWQMVLRLIADGQAVWGRVEKRLDNLEWKVLGVVVVLVVAHALVTRPRKGTP